MTIASAVKNERITFLGSAELKEYLKKEAKKEGVSLSQLIRQRCEKKPSEDELLLLELVKEVKKNSVEAREALNRGLSDAEEVLLELRSAA